MKLSDSTFSSSSSSNSHCAQLRLWQERKRQQKQQKEQDKRAKKPTMAKVKKDLKRVVEQKLAVKIWKVEKGVREEKRREIARMKEKTEMIAQQAAFQRRREATKKKLVGWKKKKQKTINTQPDDTFPNPRWKF